MSEGNWLVLSSANHFLDDVKSYVNYVVGIINTKEQLYKLKIIISIKQLGIMA